MKKEYYELWLCYLPGVGNLRGRALLSLCGQDPCRLYHAPESIWRQVVSEKVFENVRRFTKGWRLKEEFEKLQEKGIGLTVLFGERYPVRLLNIPDAPLGLFYKGRLPFQEGAVAVIGARECSPYGAYVAKELGRTLGEAGISLVSGMARGIDGISQKAALDAGGISYGVLGCGVDICYPPENKRLYEQLLERGGILSAYGPGVLPRAGNFPPRNRIVSGLSEAVVVIEAGNKSGTLITVDMALEQGREVYVTPGRVTDRLSDGCNRLLKQGAQVFLSPEEFVEELCQTNGYALGGPGNKRRGCSAAEQTRDEDRSCGKDGGKQPPAEDMDCRQQALLKVLDFTPSSPEQIQKRLPFFCPVHVLGGMLMSLCMKGKAVQISPGYFSRSS